MNIRKLIARPVLVTLTLSVMAVTFYSAYRLTTASAQDVEQQASAPAPAYPDQLPAIVLDDLAGAPTALESLGPSAMLVNFWATWCAPCLREIPMLKEFETANPDIRVVGIAYDSVEPVLEFAAEMEFNYPVLVGQADAINAATALGVQVMALPISVYVAPDGAVLGIHTGEIHAEQLDAFAATIAELESGAIDRAAARARLANRG